MDRFLLTIVIPTFNRGATFRRLYRFLIAQNVPAKILILDSSSEIIQNENRDFVINDSNCQFVSYSEKTEPFDKFLSGIEMVDTEFLMFLADDDFVLPSSVPLLLDYIKERTHVAAVQGWSFYFSLSGSDLRFLSIAGSGAHLTHALPLERVCALIADYQALTYAMMRTSVARTAFHKAAQQNSLMMKELVSGCATAAAGEVHRIPVFSHGRSAGASHNYNKWHPLEWICLDPKGLLEEYARYRHVMISEILEDDISDADLKKAVTRLDLAHLAYIAPYLRMEILTCAQELSTLDLSEEQKTEKIWQKWTEIHSAHGLARFRRSRKLAWLDSKTKIVSFVFNLLRKTNDLMNGKVYRSTGGHNQKIDTVRLSRLVNNEIRNADTPIFDWKHAEEICKY